MYSEHTMCFNGISGSVQVYLDYLTYLIHKGQGSRD